MSEQDRTCDTKIYSLQLTEINVCLPCCNETILFLEQGLFTKSKILCFTLKCTIFIQLRKYSWVVQSRHLGYLHVKYLSNQRILTFSHKLVYNYKYT